MPFDQVASLASRRSDALRSSFRPTYNMAANLVRRYTKFEAHHLLNLSFAQFHADRDVVDPRAPARPHQASSWRASASCIGADVEPVEEYRALAAELETLRRNGAAGGRRITEAMEALRPGDVVVVRRRGGRVAVLNHEHRRGGGSRLVAVTPGRDVVRLGPQDFDGPPRRAATIDLPTPFAPRNPAFRRQAADRLRRVKLHDDGRRTHARGTAPATSSRTRLAAHPLGRDPQREQKLRAAAALERFERDVQRTERRVRGRSESLARQFDRVLRVLEAWGYVDGWQLTDAGEQLARLYTETDLLLAEALREDLLDGLRPPELAAVVSCFTYERRGPDGQHPMPPARWPTKTVAKRARADRALGERAAGQRGRRRAPRDPAARTPASRPTCTTGRRATRSPTCSTTTR